MSKSTIRIMKSPDITSEATVIIVLTTDEKVIEAKMPIHAFAHAVMGVAGIDCEISEKERTKDEKWWSQEKMGTNRPPRTAPKHSSVEGWKK